MIKEENNIFMEVKEEQLVMKKLLFLTIEKNKLGICF
jgi:hypothetical protein